MKVTVYVTGGLGNKLFQLSQACNVASMQKAQIEIIEDQFTNEIEKLILGLKSKGFQIRRSNNSAVIVMVSQIKRICLRIAGMNSENVAYKVLIRSVEILVGLISKLMTKKSSQLRINNADLRNLKSDVILVGYFQDHHVANPVLVDVLTKIGAETNNFNEACAVHVRRGDYLNNPQIGTLSDSYFVNCTRIMFEEFGVSRFVIFSDSPDMLTEQVKSVSKYGNVVFAESQKSALQTLLSLSSFQFIIMSNSSFSWWAANIGSKKSKVICPSEWFKLLDDPFGIKNISWIEQESIWI